jgi:pyruvate dehydrogenase E2 component (dihydrolipoamide acetyltransferase)
METGTVVRWLKAEGDAVAKGEPLYELDTDKVTQEVEAEAAGTLLKIVVAEGEQAVGTTIAFIGEAGEDVPDVAPDEPEQSAEKPAEAPAREPERAEGRQAAAAQAEAAPAAAPSSNGGRIKASPLARRIARERGIELSSLRGTGPEGRIVAEDVERAVAQGPKAPQAAGPAGEVERIPLSSTRRTIARRLTEAWTVPVFQLTVSADMTRANALVAAHREANPDVRLTVTDVLTKVCASALLRHRAVNAAFGEDEIVRYPTANVGIAAATPAGLVVPVIRSAERLTLAEIAAARSDLVGRARDGKLALEDMQEGTFTISNLGMPQYGIEQFVAVLNPPQAAILAVGATEERPVVRDGDLEILPMVTLTATFDHRTVDGADGAEFLHTVKTTLEEPSLAL